MAQFDNSPEACQRRHLAYLKSHGHTEESYAAEQRALKIRAAQTEARRCPQRTDQRSMLLEVLEKELKNAQQQTPGEREELLARRRLWRQKELWRRELERQARETSQNPVTLLPSWQREQLYQANLAAYAAKHQAKHEIEHDPVIDPKKLYWIGKAKAEAQQARSAARPSSSAPESLDVDAKRQKRAIEKPPPQRVRFDDYEPLMIFPDGTFGTLRDAQGDRFRD